MALFNRKPLKKLKHWKKISKFFYGKHFQNNVPGKLHGAEILKKFSQKVLFQVKIKCGCFDRNKLGQSGMVSKKRRF